ncbi:sigma-70 family RNA polymerase sigma factor [Thauera phenolivorans]|uniref:sigma-70 family RNA polymerase sigma factor n=1 Tax=Thauera phenolivorans TaxID=1792543 RepID=UPI00083B9F55|nr:sigma-70 family RNA polymerase sigma factor [Thauera phenolivorans]
MLDAWTTHEAELWAYLRHHVRPPADAEDLLHDLFVKALRQGERFCAVRDPRAWLFEVARNVVVDRARRVRNGEPLPEDLAAPEFEVAVVDQLSACLPRVLAELSEEDREAISLCDIGGITQARFAQLKGLSLAGAKSRVQRARKRLRERLLRACQVRLDERGQVCCFVPRPPLE